MTELLREALGERLDYRFEDIDRLERALTHRSWRNEHDDCNEDYERLEFLGDAVVDLVLTEALFVRNPGLDEGAMTRMRAALVNETALASVARDLDLAPLLRLGKGEESSGGRDKSSILSDTVESVVGALFLDAGFERTSELILTWFDGPLAEVGGDPDYKSRLQSCVQAGGGPTPHYRTVTETGPDHDKEFEVALCIGQEEISRGTGRSKKDASQLAAMRALETDRFQDA